MLTADRAAPTESMTSSRRERHTCSSPPRRRPASADPNPVDARLSGRHHRLTTPLPAADHRVPRIELLRLLEDADDIAVPRIGGHPYQVLGDRSGALALMIARNGSAIARSGSGIWAIFASRSLSPSPLPARAWVPKIPCNLAQAVHRSNL